MLYLHTLFGICEKLGLKVLVICCSPRPDPCCSQRERTHQRELQAQQQETARQQFILKTQNILQFTKEASPPPKPSRKKVTISPLSLSILRFPHMSKRSLWFLCCMWGKAFSKLDFLREGKFVGVSVRVCGECVTKSLWWVCQQESVVCRVLGTRCPSHKYPVPCVQ